MRLQGGVSERAFHNGVANNLPLADNGHGSDYCESMERVAGWCEYLESHARDVYRKEWTSLKTKEEVQFASDILVARGWLKEMTKPKKQYRVNPAIMTGNANG